MNKSEQVKKQHSEVEAKFRASAISPADVWAYVADNCARFKVGGFREVAGWDAYYQQGDSALRHRCDGRRKTSVLTVKQRKSQSSIADRHEIDLPVREDVPAVTVTAFLEMTGWKRLFTIEKNSYIWHLTHKGVTVCLALYDVWPPAMHEADMGSERFLEIEIEKDAACTHAASLTHLEEWVSELRSVFGLGEPLNESLFEMYRPREGHKFGCYGGTPIPAEGDGWTCSNCFMSQPAPNIR